MRKELKTFGLSEKEIDVYLACLAGKQTPSQIAQTTGLKRTSAYSHLDTLKEKGLIVTRAVARNRFITAVPPRDIFPHLIEREEQSVQTKKELLDSLVAAIEKKINNKKITTSDITIYESKQELFALMDLVIQENSNIFWIGSMEAVHATIGRENFYRRFTIPRLNTTTQAYAITSRDIKNDVRFGKSLGAFRRYRVLDETKNIPAVFATVGEHVIVATVKGSKLRAVDIHDPVTASLFHLMFTALWDRLEE